MDVATALPISDIVVSFRPQGNELYGLCVTTDTQGRFGAYLEYGMGDKYELEVNPPGHNNNVKYGKRKITVRFDEEYRDGVRYAKELGTIEISRMWQISSLNLLSWLNIVKCGQEVK